MAVVRDEAYYLRGTITMLEAMVDGLRYELHMRDIQLKEKDKQIAELEQRIERAQAAGDGSRCIRVRARVACVREAQRAAAAQEEAGSQGWAQSGVAGAAAVD